MDNHSTDVKVRILAVAKMINEGRIITAAEIMKRLELDYGIKVDRKTIYADVCAIDRFLPTEKYMGRQGGYKKYDFLEVPVMEDKKQCPCLTCVKVKDPQDCENKSCKDWKEWWLKRWEALRRGNHGNK